MVVLILVLCYTCSQPKVQTSDNQATNNPVTNYRIKQILIHPDQDEAKRFIAKGEGVVYHIAIDRDRTTLFAAKYYDPFNYNRVSYVFIEDSQFTMKLCFITPEHAKQYLKDQSGAPDAYVISQNYDRAFFDRLVVEP